jgi:hypothetical protein
MRCRRYTVNDARRIRGKLRLPGGISDEALAVGMNVEREHADLVGCAMRAHAMIAARHFRERPDYYVRLLKYVEAAPRKQRKQRSEGSWSPEDYERAYGPWARRRR